MGAERMPMNWWTMAHRVGHALNRGGRETPQVQGYAYFIRRMMEFLYEMLDQVFGYHKQATWQYGPRGVMNDEKMLLALANEIGSMKSAREKKLRNLTEFFHELTAQYIIEGKVRFRSVPKMLILSYAWGRPDGSRRRHDLDPDQLEGWEEYLTDSVAGEVSDNISYALRDARGKIFVM